MTAVAGFPQDDEWKLRMGEGAAAEMAGDYAKAATAYRAAATIADRLEQPARRTVAWNSVGTMYDAEGRFTDAEGAYRRALRAAELSGGTTSSEYGLILGNLASLYVEAGQTTRAEKMMRTAMEVEDAAEPHSELRTAIVRTGLGEILVMSHKFKEAEPLFTTSLTYLENRPENWGLATSALNGLGVVRVMDGHPATAEGLFRRSLAMIEQHLGTDHPMLLRTLHNLWALTERDGRREQASEFLQRGLDIGERRLGADHPLYGILLGDYATHLRGTGEKSRAKEVQAHATQILRDSGRRNGIGAVIDVNALRGK
jgi:tetratricopeptide (TPR) repeat protein